MKEIPLTKGFVAIVDDEYFEELSKFSWCVDSRGYAVRGTSTGGVFRKVKMANQIMNPPKGMEVDHKNTANPENKRDNRRENLRVCTRSQNIMNVGKRAHNTSGFKGVFWLTQARRWKAEITVMYKRIHVGYFDTKELAAEAYRQAAEKLHGQFANTN